MERWSQASTARLELEVVRRPMLAISLRLALTDWVAADCSEEALAICVTMSCMASEP